MSKILVVYYSYSNTTKRLAENIALVTGGDIRELVPQKVYSFADNGAAKEVRIEVERGYCPKLISGNEPVDEYKYVFVGTPNWFKSFAPPVLSFLRSADLDGKIVIPFCTHGGGGIGQIETNMRRECPNSNFLPGFEATGDFYYKQIINWITEIKVLHKN